MKKILIIALCSVMAISIVGCTTEGKNKVNKTQHNLSEKKDNKNEKEKVNKTMYFGKVKSIVGNEIQLELAENQENPSDDEKDKNQEANDELGKGLSRTDVSGDGDGDGGENGESNPGNTTSPPEIDNSNKLELKYTGETKSFAIPAGAQVLDMRSGSESKLTSIKSGSVIRIYAIGSKETPTVSDVLIVE